MDEKLLSELGLSAQEIRVYMKVLKAGELTPTDLARAVDIKRTTTYGVARSLVEKGFLIEDGTKRPRTFIPASPDDIRRIIADEKKRLMNKEEKYTELAGELSRMAAKSSYPVPKIKFIQEDKMLSFMHQAMPEWDKSMLETESTWWGFQDHTFIDFFLESAEWYWNQAPEEIDLKVLTNRSSTEAKLLGKFKRRHVKFWGEATNFISTTWVVGDYVVILNTRHHPFYLVEIHDKLLAHDQREVFKNLWPLVP
jgi:sugar-specific transcriptional regulator TrmB